MGCNDIRCQKSTEQTKNKYARGAPGYDTPTTHAFDRRIPSCAASRCLPHLPSQGQRTANRCALATRQPQVGGASGRGEPSGGGGRITKKKERRRKHTIHMHLYDWWREETVDRILLFRENLNG